MNEEETINVLEKIKVREPEEQNLIRLSTGVVLRGRKVSASLLIEVITSARRPKPPTMYIEKMGRTMENTMDPDYIEQVQAYKYEQAGSLVTAMILMGTEVVSVPEGMEGPHPRSSDACEHCGVIFATESENVCGKCGAPRKATGKKKVKKEQWPGWIKDYALLGLPMNQESPSWRYLTWVKFLAAPEDTDLKTIQEVVGRLSGIREQDVRAAEEFPERNEKHQ